MFFLIRNTCNTCLILILSTLYYHIIYLREYSPFFLLGACLSHEEMVRRHNEMIQVIEDKYDGLDRGMLEFERDILSHMLKKEEMIDRHRSSSNFTSGIFLLVTEGSTGDVFSGDKENDEGWELRKNRKHRLEAINNLLNRKLQPKS